MSRRRHRLARALVLVVALGACDRAGDGEAGSAGESGDAGAALAAPTTTSTTAPAEPVTFAFGGDVHFEGVLATKLAADPGGMLAPVAPLLSGADLAVVNLETAITARGTAQPKSFTFRAPPSAFTALRAAGVDVVSMANNHGLDFGVEGLEDSLAAAAAAQFPVVGIGRTADEAYAPFTTTIKGQRIAVIGATQVLDDNLIAAWTATDTQPGLASAKEVDRLLAEVERAVASADVVVVYLHWGIEGQQCPSPVQQELGAALVAAGADMVVGGHAHRLQGAGRLGEGVVAYGLGNFAFYARGGPGADSGVLTVTVRGGRVESYQWHPAVIRDGVPRPLDGAAAADALARWDSLRECAGLAP